MLSRAERETIVTFSEEPEEAAEIYTHNPTLRAKLAYMAAEHPKEVRWHPKQYDLAEGGERYIVSREWVLRALKGMRPKKQLSTAQLEAARRAAAKATAAAAKKKPGAGEI